MTHIHLKNMITMLSYLDIWFGSAKELLCRTAQPTVFLPGDAETVFMDQLSGHVYLQGRETPASQPVSLLSTFYVTYVNNHCTRLSSSLEVAVLNYQRLCGINDLHLFLSLGTHKSDQGAC